MSTHKIISIDPSILSATLKTKKKRDKPKKETTPVISPNLIKSKLLKRIKEHKNNEIKSLNKGSVDATKEPTVINNTIVNEFDDSMNWTRSSRVTRKLSLIDVECSMILPT
jgi:hypothetical protein